MAANALPVAVHGFTWSAGLLSLLNLIVGGAVVAWIKQRPRMRELEQTGEKTLQDGLLARVTALEAANTNQSLRFEAERAQHEATMAVMRHRLNNMTMCLDALLLLIEQDATKAADAAVKIREMRARQMAAEAAEKATVHAATITAAAAAPTVPTP
nr:hypothetical protein [uncultured organism]